MLLSLETATQVCSVSLSKGTEVIACLESEETNAHSRILHVLIDRLFKESGYSLSQLDAVVVSKGPGSYTGLRIGASTAKGLCYAKDIPLISVNTLEAMAYGMREQVYDLDTREFPTSEENLESLQTLLYIPMIDARRMEVYSAIYNKDLGEVRQTTAEIITADSFIDYKNHYQLFLGGDGADKCREVLQQENIIFLDDFKASATYLIKPALKALEAKHFENVAYFEPFYLKDFIAGKPRVKGLD